MRATSIPQFAIVKTDSATSFEESLNAKLRELHPKNPVVQFSETDPFLARISYTEQQQLPESNAEKLAYSFRCEDCPMFSPMVRADGTEDQRYKYGECEYSEYGRTYKNSQCCDVLVKMIKDGRIGLCLKK